MQVRFSVLPFVVYPQLFTPERRQEIEPGPLAFVRDFPGGIYPAPSLQTVKRRIQRSGFDLEQVFRRALNVLGDRVAVSGTRKQSAEDEQVERALQELNSGSFVTTHCVDVLL